MVDLQRVGEHKMRWETARKSHRIQIHFYNSPLQQEQAHSHENGRAAMRVVGLQAGSQPFHLSRFHELAVLLH